MGAHVTATVRSFDLREQVAALGAHAVSIRRLRRRRPYDVVLELVGARTWRGT
jgi:NADPH:quinone reductase-like Zn-dependent oxidoreductase